MAQKLPKPFYLNMVKFSNTKQWYPCFDEDYAGADTLGKAVKLRRAWLEHLKQFNKDWNASSLKTMRVTFVDQIRRYPL